MTAPPELTAETVQSRLRPYFERPEIEMVVLFGSRASGTARSSSDLDLAVRGSVPLDAVDETNRLMQLLKFSAVDFVDLRHPPPTLAMVVAARGRLLYEARPGLFVSFQSLAFRRFQDAARFRKAQKGMIRDFLKERGL